MEHEIDAWIEQLSQCKQLTEADVKKLCDKVRLPRCHIREDLTANHNRQEKSSWRSLTYSLFDAQLLSVVTSTVNLCVAVDSCDLDR